MSARKLARIVLFVCAFAVAALGVAVMRTLLAGNEALDAAETAFDRGDLADSIRQARRAASLSVPSAAHVERAYGRLLVIARGAEASGQKELSLAAWEAIRAAALESAHPWSAERPEIHHANENIARLRAAGEPQQSSSRRAPQSQRALLTQLERSARPVMWSGALVGLGLCLSVAGLLWAAARGISADGRTSPRHLALGLGIAVFGVACWTLAVYTA